MNTLTCRQLEEDLVLSASGEPTSEPLRTHLERCHDCREAYTRMRATLQAFEDAAEKAPPRLPDGLHTRLTQRLQTESVPPRGAQVAHGWGKSLSQFFWHWRYSLSAVGLIIVAAILVVRSMGPQPRHLESTENRLPGPAALTRANPAGQPASPVDLRCALVRSFDDFEELLRRNDRLLAARDPVAVPVRSLSKE